MHELTVIFFSFVPHTVSIWNSLPHEIVKATTDDSFKCKLRKHYVNLLLNPVHVLSTSLNFFPLFFFIFFGGGDTFYY